MDTNTNNSVDYQKSYFRQYAIDGLLGLLLPILVVWQCGKVPSSISYSYYIGAAVPFVFVMGNLGVTFFCNHGFKGVTFLLNRPFTNVDKICNRITGLASLCVIFFPCNSPKYAFNCIPYPDIHYASAVLLFATFSFMCLFVFTQIRSSFGATKQKKMRNIIYRMFGVFILLAMIAIGLKLVTVFWGEVAMLLGYGIPYLIQGKIILRDK